ncbi:MAG TPA: hypothetical protein VLA96_13520 [Terriglobales bacterium]|nr:hypothetical protein [Terriglobales bacterium]
MKTRFYKSDKDRRMVDKDAELVFDDAERRLIVRNGDRPLNVGYDDVQKIVFDVSYHMRGGGMSQVVGGMVGAAMASAKVNDYWCYLEYRDKDGSTRKYLLEIDKDNAEAVLEKVKALFPERQMMADYEQYPELDKKMLNDLDSKHDFDNEKQDRPLPVPRADKALVVVVCPSLAARYAGKGIQFKFHANDRVVAVNKWGTYSYAYLDPGEYVVASQSENAGGGKVKLEAGQEYYFFQDTFMGTWKAKTGLSRHSKELVMYELEGTYYSDWKRKSSGDPQSAAAAALRKE